MLDVFDMPNCCTMKVLSGFGQSAHGGLHSRNRQTTEDGIVRDIEEQITLRRQQGMAMLLATTTDEQENANRALRRCGFAHSRFAEKTRHPRTRVRLWYLRLNKDGIEPQ